MENEGTYYKLKDDVDFKILKKYGFKKDTLKTGYQKEIDDKWWDLICINEFDRIIYEATEVFGDWDIEYNVKELIKDLINDGIVEEEEW